MSAINLSGNASGSGTFTIASPNSNTSYTLTLPEEAGTITTSNSPYSTFRNRIINGDMRIDQRNAGAAVTTTGSFPVDRFFVLNLTDATFSAQQSTDVPSGQGFTTSLKVTYPTGDASIGASQYSAIQYKIEGLNVADFGFGASGAQSVTLSFWVKASVAGQYSYTIYNAAENRVNPQPFTINASDTWEKKNITYAGDTTGTWVTNNGVGLQVTLYTALGSTFLGSAGWNNGGIFGVTGQSNALASNNNIFAITGVQLEVGSVATPFERIDYGRQLIQCQRYFQKSFGQSTAPANNNANGVQISLMNGQEPQVSLPLPVTMRASPTVTLFNPYGGTAGQWSNGTLSSSNARSVSITDQHIGVDNTDVTLSSWGFAEIQWTASAEL